jgi:hypothetical protein
LSGATGADQSGADEGKKSQEDESAHGRICLYSWDSVFGLFS